MNIYRNKDKHHLRSNIASLGRDQNRAVESEVIAIYTFKYGTDRWLRKYKEKRFEEMRGEE